MWFVKLLIVHRDTEYIIFSNILYLELHALDVIKEKYWFDIPQGGSTLEWESMLEIFYDSYP